MSYNALTLWAQIGWPVAIPNLDNAVVSWKPDDDDKYIMIQCLFVTFLFIPAPPPPRVVMFG